MIKITNMYLVWLLLATLLYQQHSAFVASDAIMPEKTVPLTLNSSEEFEWNLCGYLDKAQTLALLLDYDGTLAPIADHPSKTLIPRETDQILRRLASNPNIFVAVISGRGIGDVKNKVGIENITYAGNHGLEIQNPDGSRFDFELPENIRTNHTKLVNELNGKLAVNGAWVEDKRVSLTYHYREVCDTIAEEQRQEAAEIIEFFGFRANQAHCAIEAKPPVNWHKGEAALQILRTHFGNNWKDDIKVIFAGDDTTDEDAMKALKGCGKSFRVSSDPNISTYADYRLPSTDEVTLLLKWINDQY